MTSVPLMLVSSRSSTTTSGLCCSTSLTTSVPSVVQAATLMSGSPSSSARRPSITIAWSSASSTRIMVRASFGGQRDGERRAATVVRHGQGDRQAPPLDAHALPRGARVPVAVRERLLQDPVDRDLRGQGAVAQLPGQLELHGLLRQRLVLDGKALDDLAQFAALEPGGAEGADEVANLAERPLEQPHRLPGALRGGRVRRERALEHLELRQGGENVLYGPVVHVEHDALQLALTGREEAPRGGASLSVPNLGHPRPGGSARWIRSATNPSAAPIARAAATRTPPSIVTARRPMATPAPANAPAV